MPDLSCIFLSLRAFLGYSVLHILCTLMLFPRRDIFTLSNCSLKDTFIFNIFNLTKVVAMAGTAVVKEDVVVDDREGVGGESWVPG